MMIKNYKKSSPKPSDIHNENEINLIDIIRTVLMGWKVIFIITVVTTSLAVIKAIDSRDVFVAEALVFSSLEEKSTNYAKTHFGALASLAGISDSSMSKISRALAHLKTRQFLTNFISEKNLLPVIFSDYWDESSSSWVLNEGQSDFVAEDGVGVLRSSIKLRDVESDLITLSISWNDPEIAAMIANEIISYLNKQLKKKAIQDAQKKIIYLQQELAKTTLQDMKFVLYKILESEKQKSMLANVKEDFVLEVFDKAVAPTKRDSPNRIKIVIIGVFSGGLIGIASILLGKFLLKLKELLQA